VPYLRGSTFATAHCGLAPWGDVPLRQQIAALVGTGSMSRPMRDLTLALLRFERGGTIVPTREMLADVMEMGLRQIDRIKSMLRDTGILSWTNRIRLKNGKVVQTSNCYMLRLPSCGYVSPYLKESENPESSFVPWPEVAFEGAAALPKVSLEEEMELLEARWPAWRPS
jgi:hypothetical protein